MGFPGVQVGTGLLGPAWPSGTPLGWSPPSALLGLPTGVGTLSPVWGLLVDPSLDMLQYPGGYFLSNQQTNQKFNPCL